MARPAAEEHVVIRRFLQRLGSDHVYRRGTIAGEFLHEPIRIVIGSRSARAPTLAPAAGRPPGPDALAFALSGPPAAPTPAATGPPTPASTPATVELERPATAELERPAEASRVDRFIQPIEDVVIVPAAQASAALSLAAKLEAAGHRLLTRDGKLFVSDSSRLSDEDRAAIKAIKQDLIAFAEPWVEVRETSLASFLGHLPTDADSTWTAQPPPENLPDDIILNFETTGLDWIHGDEPVGVTVGTLDGQFSRYLPFAHKSGGNLDRDVVIRYLQSLRGKNILNANTRFEVHMGRNIGVDFEAQDCGVSDIMHWAALLDDHRKKFALDVLAQDYLGGAEIPRLDERNMSYYAASDVARRAEYQAVLVARLREKMLPQIQEQGLGDVLQLENETIYPVVEMEKNGSKLDVELMEKFFIECGVRHDDLMWEVSNEVGFAFEHTAAGWARLLEHLDLPQPDDFKEETLNVYDHPTVRKAQRAAQYASLNSKTFAAYRGAVDSDGILRYDINQLKSEKGGTVSGRFSIGYVQQVPNHDNHHAAFGEGDVDACKGLCDLFPRRIFIGDDCDYLEADANQIEYRIFAHLAQNKAVLAAYARDPWMSFHKTTWAMMKQYKPDMLYSHQKNFNFAKMYAARIIKLAVMMGFITEREAVEIRARKAWGDPRLTLIKEIDNIYNRIMPEVNQLLDKASHLMKPTCDEYCKPGDALHRQFKHRGYVKTLSGRRSRSPDGYKSYIGLNRVIQGTASDIMKRKLVELHKARKYTGLLLRLTVHDQVGGDARLPETKERVAEVLNKQSFDLRVPIFWTVNTGPNWAACK